jgi:hypothetical protein
LFKNLKPNNEYGKRLLDKWNYHKSLWQNQNYKENEARLKDAMAKFGLYGSKKEKDANLNSFNKMENVLKLSQDLSILKTFYDHKYSVPIKYLHENGSPEKLPENLPYLPIVVGISNVELFAIGREGLTEDRMSPKFREYLLEVMLSYSIFMKKNILQGIDKKHASSFISDFDRMKIIGHREVYKENERRIKLFLRMLGAM